MDPRYFPSPAAGVARPIVAVADVQAWTGTTYAAANAMVARLVDLGILEEFTGHARNRWFRYAPYIALFHEQAS